MTAVTQPPTKPSRLGLRLAPLLKELAGALGTVVVIEPSPDGLVQEIRQQGIQVRACPLKEALPPAAPASIALCLEGAESLPAEASLPLVQRLCQMADLVVFSAALPGQMGLDQILCQPTLYWCDLFEICGFKRHDVLRQKLLSDHAIPWQQRQNLVLYARRHSPSEQRIETLGWPSFLPAEFELVHHTMITNGLLFQWIKPQPPSLGELIKALPKAALKTLRCRVDAISTMLARLDQR